MPITTDIRDEDRIVTIRLEGQLTAQEVENVNVSVILPFMQQHKPEYINVIWDVTALTMDFANFIKILSYMAERRKNSEMTLSVNQHYVGANSWISTLRTWMQKNYKVDTSSFASVEDAIAYIKS